MDKFRLAIGLHNHQPIGNFEHVFEQAHRDAYAAFLDVIRQFPRLRMSLHQSGILWDWQEQHHPEYLDAVRRMVEAGQLELLTGGFYEPILTSIPTRDLHGQIEMLTQYVKKHFGVEPTGLWLTERVWEPQLPRVLALSGVKFLPVDDTHFIFAGLELSQLTGPFVTEYEGYTVTLLPIQKRLRYLIPFGQVEDVITELKRQAEQRPDGVAVYGDDGEKFGVWPNTHKHCYEDGWLPRFFEAVDRNSDWLEMVPLGEAAAMRPVGRVYLPSASYEEMGHWALPTPAFVQYENFEHWLKQVHDADKYGRFVRGGHWRGFLSKYDESNLMHKKMLWVSNRLARFEADNPKLSRAIDEIRDRLFASQCNCAYWHGVFGGLYLPHLRQAVYAAAIEADTKLRDLSGTTRTIITAEDFDADTAPEIIVQSRDYTAAFKPDKGGILLDLALNKYAFDLTDTLTRRREGYHAKLPKARPEGQVDNTASIHDLVLAKEPHLEQYLVEDWYLKRCFIDHFLPDDADLDSFQRARIREEGDFVQGLYQYEYDEASGTVTMYRDGFVSRQQRDHAVRVRKSFRFDDNAERITVTYELSTLDGFALPCVFAVENNFSFQAGHADDRYLLIDSHRPAESYLDSVGAHAQAQTVTMVDEWRQLAVALRSSQPCEIWHHPLYTVSLSEAGFEKVYQGTTLVQLHRVTLSDKPIILEITMYAGDMRGVLGESQSVETAHTT